MDALYAKYAKDFSIHLSSLINKRVAYTIKNNLTFKEDSTNEDKDLALAIMVK